MDEETCTEAETGLEEGYSPLEMGAEEEGLEAGVEEGMCTEIEAVLEEGLTEYSVLEAGVDEAGLEIGVEDSCLDTGVDEL